MSGAGGQTTIPDHDLVARQGHYRGGRFGGQALRRALVLLMEAAESLSPGAPAT